MKDEIFFIINPISGTKNKEEDIKEFKRTMDSRNIPYRLSITEYAGQAFVLAARAAKEGFGKVVAVGGDGTINEVASALTETDVALGIIPYGSGNGLARHLGLSLNPMKALATILDGQETYIDYCSVNGKKFFCAFGVGFDASVAKEFAEQNKRGLATYIRSSLRVHEKYTPQLYKVKYDDEEITEPFYIVSVCNASQYGNDAKIAPRADIADGLLDIVMVRPGTLLSQLEMTFEMFIGILKESKTILFRQAHKVDISNLTSDCFPAHIDGEPIEMQGNLTILCHRHGLKVLVPLS